MLKAILQGYIQHRDPLVAMETQLSPLVSLRQFETVFVLLDLYSRLLTESK